MKLLGHKDIKNTLIYTQLIQTKDDDFICKTARTIDQAKTLVEAGFDYFCEIEGTRPFRKENKLKLSARSRKRGEALIPDRYVDIFQGIAPTNILAKHYKPQGSKLLREIYEKTNLTVLD